MTRFHRLRPALALAIVVAVAGCDNIQWGGAQVAVAPPPPREVDDDDAPPAPGEERVPDGPILFYVRAEDDGRAVALPVGEIARDTLVPVQAVADWEVFGDRFISRHLREGTELSLFRRGARVGTLVVQTAAVPDAQVCPRVPRARGVMELMAGVEPAGEFLAMAKPQAPTQTLPQPFTQDPPGVMQRLAPILAERLIRARRAPLPGNWQRAMQQLKPFPMADAADAGFAATLMVGDTLAPQGRSEGYSLFFIGEPVPRVGYDTVFVHYSDYAAEGRAARGVVDFLDWDRDGNSDLLLRVYGEGESWFEAVTRVNGQWRRVFSDRCPRAPAPEPGAEAGAGQPAG